MHHYCVAPYVVDCKYNQVEKKQGDNVLNMQSPINTRICIHYMVTYEHYETQTVLPLQTHGNKPTVFNNYQYTLCAKKHHIIW